jgi:homoserine dehydrogenase
MITENASLLRDAAGEAVEIKYIVDIRDFPDSPFADRLIKDFSIVEQDDEVSLVIEVIGGAGVAYDFTKRALLAGKSVVSSNKELVATHGVELLALAREKGVHYLFEAAVGGGIPVLAPLMTELSHNVITEISGILNGTTNYILTRMFHSGATFAEALAEAQAKGYAEQNPSADVDGIDACRKIAILGALAMGKMVPSSAIHTEGIRAIRAEDVAAANKNHMAIKLLGRAICEDNGKVMLMVAPFLIDAGAPLGGVHGVYNAVEVIGDPIDNVMFYGRGAGAGPTASAVVGDLCRSFTEGTHTAPFAFEKQPERLADFSAFACAHYVATDASLDAVKAAFGEVTVLGEGKELAILTSEMTEAAFEACTKKFAGKILSHIRRLA